MRRGIVVTLNPDATREATEFVVRAQVGTELPTVRLRETARVLPLAEKAAKEWAEAVMNDSDEESR